MSVIAAIQYSVNHKMPLYIGKQELSALRIYMNDRKRRSTPAIRNAFNKALSERGPHLLESLFAFDSVEWIRKLLYRGDGAWRATPITGRFSEADKFVMDTFTSFEFLRMVEHRELWYPLFRANGEGDSFTFYNVPWQASMNPENTGLFIVDHATGVVPGKAMLQGYLTAALWAETHTPTRPEGREGDSFPLDDKYGIEDIVPTSRLHAWGDCIRFARAHWADVSEAARELEGGWPSVGHDFWLSRNGHGAGFFDRDELRENGVGERLHAVTGFGTSFDSANIYVGDSGKVYID